MHSSLGRYAVGRSSSSPIHSSIRASITRRVALTLFGFLVTTCAQAVVIRGRVTDALGKAVPGGMVRLVEGGKTVAFAYAEADGSYEIRSSDAGRFTLLGSAGGYLPAIGTDFYGGVTDVLQQDVVLAANTVRQDITVSATGIPTPLPQLTSPVSVTVVPEAVSGSSARRLVSLRCSERTVPISAL